MGIVWLIPIFGIYFCVKLVRGGFAPESAGKVIGFAVLGLLAAVVIVLTLTGDPNVNVSFAGAILQQLVWAVASLVSVLIVRKVWPAFFRIMLCYAFASRIPVLIVMFIAMLGNWGTHYELGNSSFPEMGFLTKFIMIAVLPQMTLWIMVTMVFGTLFGGIAAAVVRPKAPTEGAKS